MARVRRVRPRRDAGISRTRSDDRFGYVTADGHPVDPADAERIDALAIPPAWTDVWICARPTGHVQAVGTDADGRTQYIYHPDWRRRRDGAKYDRALALAAALPTARGRATRSLRAEGAATEETVLAVAFRLLDLTGVRMGSTAYLRRSGNRGLTTLQRRHLVVDGTAVRLVFRGKSGKRQEIPLEDADVVTVLARLAEGSARTVLLSWREGRRRRSITPARLNAYLGELTGGTFTAKDFRTLRGTIIAAQALAESGPQRKRAARLAAERTAVAACAAGLGNTPSVARSSYIDPRLFARYRSGRVLDTARSPDAALRDLLIG
ncbi:DNA topoisomerase IB [Mycetocola reblochoni]|uniref:DNA topoisomerase n=2 Tax=Mycetocola reblochoni TaxID=331618 RepID=A0A1R4KD16_9MICO|nr:DNA topoisomerase IB [Mycetocola reblochoni]RLP71246.1 DNA topoisomerase IB [Mycetocola reblochoni]SJN42200.1 Hypothetical protein PA2244 (similar to DNA topoisomerase IB, but possibly involved in glycosyl-transfer) [Mycetocola reblochoni REB411]